LLTVDAPYLTKVCKLWSSNNKKLLALTTLHNTRVVTALPLYLDRKPVLTYEGVTRARIEQLLHIDIKAQLNLGGSN
jgi:hypothetical protein